MLSHTTMGSRKRAVRKMNPSSNFRGVGNRNKVYETAAQAAKVRAGGGTIFVGITFAALLFVPSGAVWASDDVEAQLCSWSETLAVPEGAPLATDNCALSPGGGETAGAGVCDTVLGTACAAAAAVALDGCVVAQFQGNGGATAYLFFVIPVGSAYASAEGTIVSCMSLAVGLSVTWVNGLPGNMYNYAVAIQRNDTGSHPTSHSQLCVNNLLQSSFCGPTGVSLQVPYRACVMARSGGWANTPLAAAPGGVAAPGGANIYVRAESPSCRVKSTVESIFSGEPQETQKGVPLGSLPEHVRGEALAAAKDYAAGQIHTAVSRITQGEHDGQLAAMAEMMQKRLSEDVLAALERL